SIARAAAGPQAAPPVAALGDSGAARPPRLDGSRALVAEHHLHGETALVHVEVGVAHAGGAHADEQLTRARVGEVQVEDFQLLLTGENSSSNHGDTPWADGRARCWTTG